MSMTALPFYCRMRRVPILVADLIDFYLSVSDHIKPSDTAPLVEETVDAPFLTDRQVDLQQDDAPQMPDVLVPYVSDVSAGGFAVSDVATKLPVVFVPYVSHESTGEKETSKRKNVAAAVDSSYPACWPEDIIHSAEVSLPISATLGKW